MTKKRVFISFDYDHDLDIKGCFVSQTENDYCPFKVIDMSIQEPIINENWRREARNRIKKCDMVIVLCGEHTKDAPGVTAELTITQELNKPYILLRGRKNKHVQKPNSSLRQDQVINWKWNEINRLLSRGR